MIPLRNCQWKKGYKGLYLPSSKFYLEEGVTKLTVVSHVTEKKVVFYRWSGVPYILLVEELPKNVVCFIGDTYAPIRTLIWGPQDELDLCKKLIGDEKDGTGN